MNPALGLLFLQGYVATPRALAQLSPGRVPDAAAPDLVDRIVDAIGQKPGPVPVYRQDACTA